MGNILVVEDDLAVGEVICDTLRDRGLNVQCVRTEEQAYARITSFPGLDGLVLDVNLGGGATGFDIARFARQVMPDIAVVYVSGNSSPTAFKAFGVPDSEFVEKPFTPDDLAVAVTSRLDVHDPRVSVPLV
jgi:CheY-like chemotaxis protein